MCPTPPEAVAGGKRKPLTRLRFAAAAHAGRGTAAMPGHSQASMQQSGRYGSWANTEDADAGNRHRQAVARTNGAATSDRPCVAGTGDCGLHAISPATVALTIALLPNNHAPRSADLSPPVNSRVSAITNCFYLYNYQTLANSESTAPTARGACQYRT